MYEESFYDFNNHVLLFILKGSWIQDTDPFRSLLGRELIGIGELHLGVSLLRKDLGSLDQSLGLGIDFGFSIIFLPLLFKPWRFGILEQHLE